MTAQAPALRKLFFALQKAAAISILFFLIAAVSHADTIIFKDGRQVETINAWEEGNQVKCERFGTVVGYPRSTVERIERNKVTVNKALLVDCEDKGGFRVDIPGGFVSYTLEAWVFPITKEWPEKSELHGDRFFGCLHYFDSIKKRYPERGIDFNPEFVLFSIPEQDNSVGRMREFVKIQKDGKAIGRAVTILTRRDFSKELEAIPGDYAVMPKQWNHLALSVDGYGPWGRLYLNGREIGWLNMENEDKRDKERFAKYPSSMLNLRIGLRGSGYIDEVRLWGCSLSAEEINANMRRKLKGDEEGLFVN